MHSIPRLLASSLSLGVVISRILLFPRFFALAKCEGETPRPAWEGRKEGRKERRKGGREGGKEESSPHSTWWQSKRKEAGGAPAASRFAFRGLRQSARLCVQLPQGFGSGRSPVPTAPWHPTAQLCLSPSQKLAAASRRCVVIVKKVTSDSRRVPGSDSTAVPGRLRVASQQRRPLPVGYRLPLPSRQNAAVSQLACFSIAGDAGEGWGRAAEGWKPN